MSSRLADVHRVFVEDGVVSATLASLQEAGEREFECLALWLGSVDRDRAVVSEIIVPTQKAVRSEDGVGYFVESDELFELNKMLADSGLRLIAQVHSHPGEAYHSTTDDEYAIVTVEGGFSLVVPDFGHASPNPATWAVYRLKHGEWKELTSRQASQIFALTEAQ